MKKLNVLISGLFLATSTSFVYGQDNCVDASSANFTSDAQSNTQYCFDNLTINTSVGANSASNPTPSCGTPVNDIWTQFTITNGPLNILIEGSGFDSSGNGGNARDLDFEVYSSTGTCSGFTVIGCANNNVNGGAESLTLNGLANGTYYIRFYSGINGTILNADLCITATSTPPPPAPPANDDCANAIPVAVGADGICTEVTGTNTDATDSGVLNPSCSFYQGGDVWYSIVVPPSGNVTFASDYADANSLVDIGMAIYSGTCASLTEVDCDDDSGNGTMSSISASGLTAGATLFVRVWEYGNDEFGNFDLCFSEPPSSDANQDCSSSQGICTDATLNGNSNGAGNITDLNVTNQDCLSVEHQSSWFNLEIATPGSFEFTLSPDNNSDDYDFSIWVYPSGAGEVCPPATTPTRCSFAAGSGLNSSYDTGLGQGAVDESEDVSGDNWVAPIDVNVGDVVVVLIDNFSSTTSPFTIDFTGNAGLDCSVVLPIELMTFYAKKVKSIHRLYWQTATEYNNDYFTIEHSSDGINWRSIGIVKGSGTTSQKQYYSFDHLDYTEGINYYKLYQTDIDGEVSNTKIISLKNDSTKELVKSINLMGQDVDSYYHGIVIDFYSDGSSVKRLQ